jgi:tripartite-type tricarboxylate transporter receptor subunit TctC
MFKQLTGVDIVHVPYRGSAPAITDLLGGQMQFYFDNFANVLQHVESGKLRALAVSGDTRNPKLPNVPTMGQSGYGGIVATYWNGMLAPARTPPAVLAKLNAAVNKALAAPEVRAALQRLGSEPKAATSQEFAAFVADEIQRWRKVVRDAKITVE